MLGGGGQEGAGSRVRVDGRCSSCSQGGSRWWTGWWAHECGCAAQDLSSHLSGAAEGALCRFIVGKQLGQASVVRSDPSRLTVILPEFLKSEYLISRPKFCSDCYGLLSARALSVIAGRVSLVPLANAAGAPRYRS